MNEERPFELPGVIEAEPEKSKGEMATSALLSTVIEKEEDDEGTEEEKNNRVDSTNPGKGSRSHCHCHC